MIPQDSSSSDSEYVIAASITGIVVVVVVFFFFDFLLNVLGRKIPFFLPGDGDPERLFWPRNNLNSFGILFDFLFVGIGNNKLTTRKNQEESKHQTSIRYRARTFSNFQRFIKWREGNGFFYRSMPACCHITIND
mmetsp:Transcript_62303/g.126894  ORF Transcript_62303/g.126894 Transcript_62303/m.126894 type:complete len:135 (+) Transcript_62303:2351-2755(+)